MDVNHILIDGCNLCAIFLESGCNHNIIYKDGETLNKSSFIVTKCSGNMRVVVRDHVDNIPNSLWGKILYQCRNEYGYNIRVDTSEKDIDEHWFAKIHRVI